MDKLELLVSRHKKIIRKEKYKKADKKLDIIFVQACYYVVNEYLGLKDQFRNVSENISFPDFCSSYLETVEKKDRRFAEIIRSYLFHESIYAMEIKCSKNCISAKESRTETSLFKYLQTEYDGQKGFLLSVGDDTDGFTLEGSGTEEAGTLNGFYTIFSGSEELA